MKRWLESALRDWKSLGLFFICLAIGGVFSAGLYTWAQREEATRLRLAFYRDADQVMAQVKRTFDLKFTILTSLASYLSTAEFDEPSFQAYVDPFLTARGIQALEWIPRVRHEERAAFEATATRMHPHALTAYEITELDTEGNLVSAGPRAEYFPVLCVSPVEGNEKALGYDLGSETRRREALECGRDSGMLAATPGIQLVQAGKSHYGFLVYHPVYSGLGTPPTESARRENLRGFAVGVFIIGDIMSEALAPDSVGADVSIFIEDVTDSESPELVYGPALRGPDGLDGTSALGRSGSNRIRPYSNVLLIGERRWAFTLTPTEAFFYEHASQQAGVILVAGLIVTLLITAFVTQGSLRAVRMEELRDLALAADQAKSTFIANVSHGIRTPLNAIIGVLHMFRGERITDRQREFIETIEGSSEDLLAIINEILDINKISSGKFILERVVFDLRQSIEDVFRLQQGAGSGNSVSWELKLSSRVPRWIIGDGVRLRAVLGNLLNNAGKFTKSGSITLTGGVLERRAHDILLRFEVADTGIGIDSENADALFEPFVQGRASTTREYGGTGLGLPISKRIVELMGGEMGVIGRGKQGSTFWFTLAAEIPESTLCLEEQPQPESLDSAIDSKKEAPIRPTSASSAKPISVLLAEDDSVSARIFAYMAEELHCSCEVVNDGAQAVQACSRRQFDAVFMDCRMPGMDGYEATRRIRMLPGKSGRTPIIALTGSVMAEDRSACAEAGMSGFLAKPIDPEKLHSILLQCRDERAMNELRSQIIQPLDDAPDYEAAPIGDNPSGDLLDIEWIDRISRSNPRAAKEFLEVFLEHKLALLEDLKHAAQRRDWEEMKIGVHMLKGSSYQIGVFGIGRLAARIEKLIADEQYEEIPRHMDLLEEEFNRLPPEIENLTGREPSAR